MRDTRYPHRRPSADLLGRLAKLSARPAPPFESVPREYLKSTVWLEPRRGQGRFRGWPTDFSDKPALEGGLPMKIGTWRASCRRHRRG